MDRSPRQDVEKARPVSAFETDVGSSARQEVGAGQASSMDQTSNPFSQGREIASHQPPAGWPICSYSSDLACSEYLERGGAWTPQTADLSLAS